MTRVENNSNDRESTFGLDSDKLAQLLQIGSEIQETETALDLNQQKSLCLKERLEQTLPLDQSFAKTIPPFVARLCERNGLLAGESIRGLLNNPDTPVSLVEKLKDYAKGLTETAKTEPDADTAIVLYYAAIAHAMIYSKARISRFSYPSLIESFTSLTEKDWIEPMCQDLFTKAVQECKQQNQKSSNQDG